MRVTQLMLIVLSGLALAGCPKKPQTLPDACNPPEQTSADTGATSDTDVSGECDRVANEQAEAGSDQAPARSSTSTTTAPRSSLSSCRSSPRTPST